MRIFTLLRSRIDAFRSEESASQSVEVLLLVPMLLWAFLGTYTYFDVFRARNLALKANYAVSDLLSRETEDIDMDYILGMEDVYQYLTRGGNSAWLRVTMIYCESDCALESSRTLKQTWSKATDGLRENTDADLNGSYNARIPLMAENEYVIMVESGVGYQPPFNTGLTRIDRMMLVDTVMTRPRFGVPKWTSV